MAKRFSFLHGILAPLLLLVSGNSYCFADNSETPYSPKFREIRGYAVVDGRLFPEEGVFSGQSRHQVSSAVEPEYYIEWPGYTSLTITPFMRVDAADSRRTHADLREFLLRIVPGNWMIASGLGKVFWGVTESKHLVDVINQTDVIEGPAGEDKFGQPMVNLSVTNDWGFVDIFIMPYFRERIFVP